MEHQKSILPVVPPGERLEARYSLLLKKRGAYVLEGSMAETFFPFGLMASGTFFRNPVSLLVYPRFHPLATLEIPVGRRYQPGGPAWTSAGRTRAAKPSHLFEGMRLPSE